MGRLKAQIKESIFNPLLLIYPVFLFIATNPVVGNQSWKCIITLGVTVFLTLYVYKRYKGLFKWYLFNMLLFLLIAVCMCVGARLVTSEILSPIIETLIFLAGLLVFFAFRKPIEALSDKLVSPLLPMSNNLAGLYRAMRILISFSVGYLSLYFIFSSVNNSHTDLYIEILKYVYLGIMILYTVFEIINEKIIRSQLVNERWLPIITKEGKVVGSIQRLSSFSDRRKYTHPVVRGVLIRDGKILLQKPLMNDLFYKSEWEVFIAGHIGIGETAENSLKKNALENFGIDDLQTFFLSKYMHDTPYEHQYVLLLIICSYSGEIVANPQKIEQLKWWTPQQIEDNLDAGIFSENFVREYELLKRSGLLDDEERNCKCESEAVSLY